MNSVLLQLAQRVEATPADLAALDVEIARLQGVRDLVAAALEAATVRVVPVPAPSAGAPGKSLPPARPGERLGARLGAKPGSAPADRSRACRDRRLALARLLLPAPLSATELATRTGFPKGSMSSLLDHEWFRKTSPEKNAPYALSDAGRAAASEPVTS